MTTLRVSQAKIHEGDTKFYVVNAAGTIIRGPFLSRSQADVAVENYERRIRRIREARA